MSSIKNVILLVQRIKGKQERSNIVRMELGIYAEQSDWIERGDAILSKIRRRRAEMPI